MFLGLLVPEAQDPDPLPRDAASAIEYLQLSCLLPYLVFLEALQAL